MAGDAHCSVNGLLALELALDTLSGDSEISSSPTTSQQRDDALWRKTLPSQDSFKHSMPYFWTSDLQSLLPPTASTLLQRQIVKLSRDWTAVSDCYDQLSAEHYAYHWLLVSTRTFYYTPPEDLSSPEADATTPRESDECLAIVPFGDYFNHSSSAIEGCKVSYSPKGYEFVVEEATPQGAELFISYGNHSNDFLLVEYGFIIPDDGEHNNVHDALALDPVVLPLFTPSQRDLLASAGYLGNYFLNAMTPPLTRTMTANGGEPEINDLVCYRTTTALRLLCMPLRKWKRGVSGGFDDADTHGRQVVNLILKVLSTYSRMAEEKLQLASQLDVPVTDTGDITNGGGSTDANTWTSQMTVLERRWGQILAQLAAASEILRRRGPRPKR